MIFYNKNKFLMYKILIKFNKCKSIEDTQIFIINKYKIDKKDFSYLISQCVEQQLLNGIIANKTANNYYHIFCSENIYLTYYGYEFIKNYYGWIKKLLRDLFLIFITAIITVIINNELDNTNQIHNPECQCYSTK